MGAALNVYRPVVSGQRAPNNQRQASAQQAQPQYQQRQVQQGPGQYAPPGQYQNQQAPQTQHQQRQAHRQVYAESAMRAQQGQQMGPPQNQGWNYGQWQQSGQQGYVQQNGMYAPGAPQGFVQQGMQQPQQPQHQYQAPALQQAFVPQGQLPGYATPIQHFASRADERVYGHDGQFNPQAYGGFRQDIQQALGDTQNRVFNKSGTINAYDTKDALQQIKHILTHATQDARTARWSRQASQMMTEERRQVLAAAIQDPEGFAIMGQELLLPIKDIADYEGWARKVFRVRPLAQGELFRMAKDVRSTAWVIGQDGQGIEARLFGRFVTPSEFKIGSFPTVDIEDIYQMNYDVLDRAQDTARQEIELEEDKRGRALVDVSAQTVNAVTSFTTLGVAAFEDIRYQVERHRLVVEKFLINRAELSDIVKTMSAQVDPVTERELILAGYIGSFLNAVILTAAGTGVEEVVPAGTVYACTGPEFMGEMGIRVELFSEPFNMFSQFRFVKGWAFGEIIGFVVANPRAIAKGVK